MVDLMQPFTQSRFGELVGISQQAVSALVQRGVLGADQNGLGWLHAYCAHLREQAAGRAATGDLDLAAERAALAKVQRERIELQNAVTRRELAPIETLEMALAMMGRKVAAVLESIPVKLKRRTTHLTSEDIEAVTAEITIARNIAASAQLDMDDSDGSIGDSESDREWSEEPGGAAADATVGMGG